MGDDEWSGEFRTQDGSLIPRSTVDYVLHQVDAVKRKCSSGRVNTSTVTASVEELLRDCFAARSSASTPPSSPTDHDPDLLRSIFDWILTYERIDNACPDLRLLSVTGYTDFQDCEPGSLVSFRNGFKSVVDALVNHLPPETVMLRQQVTRISVSGSGVTVCSNDKELQARHVVVTVSLGVLKAGVIVFEPPLPPPLQQQIQAIGFGTINKVFLRFSPPFWSDPCFSLKLVWTATTAQERDGEGGDLTELPDWVRDISSFDAVRGRRDMLMAWVGGHGAQRIERESDSRISEVCRKVISIFTQKTDVPEAELVLCTKWFSNRLFSGSYSHPTTTCDALGIRLSDQHLFAPVTRVPAPLSPSSSPVSLQQQQEQEQPPQEEPVILFAGEHTSRRSYSTAHGALVSGNHSPVMDL